MISFQYTDMFMIPLYITALNSYPNKDANLNTKEQSCNASNGPKQKILFIYMPQKDSLIIIHLKWQTFKITSLHSIHFTSRYHESTSEQETKMLIIKT